MQIFTTELGWMNELIDPGWRLPTATPPTWSQRTVEHVPPSRIVIHRWNWPPLGGILLFAFAAVSRSARRCLPQCSRSSYAERRNTHSYVAPAQSLLADGTFSRDGTPEIVRTPGYPLLLAIGLLSGHAELVTVGLHIILSVASIALVYGLAWELTANSAAALCAIARWRHWNRCRFSSRCACCRRRCSRF